MNTNIKVPFVDLKAQYLPIKSEINAAIQNVLDSQQFIGGSEVEAFERDFARLHKAKYCVGVSSGTAALHLALWTLPLNQGEVILPVNTFIATAEAVTLAGYKPVFVDVDEKTHNIDIDKIEAAITDETVAILPVHLYGKPVEMNEIMAIAHRHNHDFLPIIEDCCQAHAAFHRGKPVGTFGEAGCFSFYPSKNLGAYGEAGAIITNDEDLYHEIKSRSNHGRNALLKHKHDYIGHNYRLDAIQAAVLNVKLKHIQEWTIKRQANAQYYHMVLSDIPEITLPERDVRHVYHLCVIRAPHRGELANYLRNQGIETGIHYPIPLHLQLPYNDLYPPGSFPVAERLAQEILSLPMYPELTKKQMDYVAESIWTFYRI